MSECPNLCGRSISHRRAHRIVRYSRPTKIRDKSFRTERPGDARKTTRPRRANAERIARRQIDARATIRASDVDLEQRAKAGDGRVRRDPESDGGDGADVGARGVFRTAQGGIKRLERGALEDEGPGRNGRTRR